MIDWTLDWSLCLNIACTSFDCVWSIFVFKMSDNKPSDSMKRCGNDRRELCVGKLGSPQQFLAWLFSVELHWCWRERVWWKIACFWLRCCVRLSYCCLGKYSLPLSDESLHAGWNQNKTPGKYSDAKKLPYCSLAYLIAIQFALLFKAPPLA